jgi:HSP20 family protein
MTNLIRWEPAREIMTLREAMDRLFDEAFTRPFDLFESWRGPALDMYQTKDEIVVRLALPGLKSDDVEINVTGDILTVKGEYKQKDESKERNYHIREQRWGAFERSVILPAPIVAEKAKAEFEDGILTITLPKAEEARPKTITVKAK